VAGARARRLRHSGAARKPNWCPTGVSKGMVALVRRRQGGGEARCKTNLVAVEGRRRNGGAEVELSAVSRSPARFLERGSGWRARVEVRGRGGFGQANLSALELAGGQSGGDARRLRRRMADTRRARSAAASSEARERAGGGGRADAGRAEAAAAARARGGGVGRFGQRAKREAEARLGEKLVFQIIIFK
jgi:hypothetical protein